MELPDTIGFLRGSWLVDRVIDDHLTGIRSRFVGTASLAGPEGGAGPGQAKDDSPLATFRYQERGQLRCGRLVTRASRRLSYRRTGGAAAVSFADGRPFVHLDLRHGSWLAEHLCGDDCYEVATEVTSAHTMEERWRVAGPAKDYEAVTLWLRGPG
ncbi:MAG: DUF6314 family protein [Acidimicrobiales bacterium]